MKISRQAPKNAAAAPLMDLHEQSRPKVWKETLNKQQKTCIKQSAQQE